MYRRAGLRGEGILFLLTDSQVRVRAAPFFALLILTLQLPACFLPSPPPHSPSLKTPP